MVKGLQSARRDLLDLLDLRIVRTNDELLRRLPSKPRIERIRLAGQMCQMWRGERLALREESRRDHE